jgi:hypothetical protein
MKNMAFASVGRVIIAMHNELPPTNGEWEEYVKILQKVTDLSAIRTMALTDGGAPNSNQRKQLNDILRGRPNLGAVVTGNGLVRSVVTALTWFNPAVKAFPPERVKEAYVHLQLGPLEVEGVERQIQVLAKTFGVPLNCIPR